MSELYISKMLTIEKVINGYHVFCRRKTANGSHMQTYVFNDYGALEEFAKTYFIVEDWSKKEEKKDDKEAVEC